MKYAAIIATLGLGSAAFLVMAAPPDGHGPMAGRLKQADTNGDGMISREEAAALPMISKHFDQLDTNKDGYLTPDELAAAHARHHPK